MEPKHLPYWSLINEEKRFEGPPNVNAKRTPTNDCWQITNGCCMKRVCLVEDHNTTKTGQNYCTNQWIVRRENVQEHPIYLTGTPWFPVFPSTNSLNQETN